MSTTDVDVTLTDPAATVPRPITPGPHMTDLARFCRDVTWSGAIAAGGMGPGTPSMTARGVGTHTFIQDGRWIVGTYAQEQYLPDGTHVLTWQLHWVAGWDPGRGEYVATLADCYGHADIMFGHIDGDQLIFETGPGAPVQLRLTWDATDPDDLLWRNDTAIEGGPWTLVECYHMTPMRP